jgi:hypothetical protein
MSKQNYEFECPPATAFGEWGADGEERGVDLVGVEVSPGGRKRSMGAAGAAEGEQRGPVEAVVRR